MPPWLTSASMSTMRPVTTDEGRVPLIGPRGSGITTALAENVRGRPPLTVTAWNGCFVHSTTVGTEKPDMTGAPPPMSADSTAVRISFSRSRSDALLSGFPLKALG